MAAPTPVSAYLHSAAMVAAGVFLLSRVHPLLALEPGLLDALLVVGLASMAVGGVLALGANGLKRLLAYSTISQYGYVVTMLGVGGKAGAAAACFYVLAHAIAKSGLFLTAGAVTQATGGKGLRDVGGLARRMPLPGRGQRGLCRDDRRAAADDRVLQGRALLQGGARARHAARRPRRRGRGADVRVHGAFWTGIFLGRRPARPSPRAAARVADRRPRARRRGRAASWSGRSPSSAPTPPR
jgi:multicomponent Na+:H+ antiporter subunit A